MIKKYVPLFIILLIGAIFRLHGLNWDQGNHLHPDERFLVMVGTAMSWPSSLPGYLDPATSKLNPHNIGFDFYVYGTLPVIIVKVFATLFSMDNYDQFLIIGRIVTATFETSIIVIIFLLAKRLSKSNLIAIFSAFVYSVSALPIQLAHFFAVDTYLIFFILVSLLLATYKSKSATVFSGLAFALGLSSKVSGVILLPIVLLQLIYSTRKLSSIIIFGVSSLVCFRFAFPYLFATSDIITGLNDKVLANWRQLESFNDPSGWFPPGVQWISAKKFIFPLQNIVFWGLGIPLSVFTAISICFSVKNIRKHFWLSIPLTGILIIFIYQGSRFAMPMRYFYPLYPLVAILVGFMFSQLKSKTIAYCLIPIALLLWPISVNQIYTRPHTRVSATNWILQNIPMGSRISCEHWDDCLPLGGTGAYQVVELPLYNPDGPQKDTDLALRLASIDYLILSSNRLYGSISSVPEKYPQTSKYYANLFANKTEFKKIVEFTSRPTLPLPFISKCIQFPFSGAYGLVTKSDNCKADGISFIDDYADETWTVYDHPKVTIFKNTK